MTPAPTSAAPTSACLASTYLARAALLAAAWLGLAAAPAPARTPPPARAGDAVTDFHGTPRHDGVFPVAGLSPANVADTRPDPSFDATLPGLLNAQPLYWRAPGASHGMVIAASEANVVAAFDAVTGRTLWQSRLGPPARRDGLCGNINPVGITGTPVIDARRGRLYADAVLATAGGQRHVLFGLDLRDGAVLPGFPVALGAGLAKLGVRFDDGLQENRTALQRLGGHVFIAFGGYVGDCGPYHGIIAAVSTTKPRVTAAWTTGEATGGATGGATKGGIWSPGALVSDGRFLYVVTGNTEGAADWAGGEAVLRFTPDLARPDYFVPENWRDLDATDLDIGGVNPTLIDLPGSHPGSLVLALGKDGKAYVLDRDHLPGLAPALLTRKVSDTELRGSTATYGVGPTRYVVMPDPGRNCPGPGGLTALALTASHGGPALRQAWCARLRGFGSPIVTEGAPGRSPIIWATGAEGDERLHAFDGVTGKPLYQSAPLAARVPHFSTLLVAEGRLYVPADGRIFAFRLPGTGPRVGQRVEHRVGSRVGP